VELLGQSKGPFRRLCGKRDRPLAMGQVIGL